MKNSSPKLFLSADQRRRLREFGIPLRDVADCDVTRLAEVLGVSRERARMLRASAEFQRVPTVGPKAAAWCMDLGYRSLDEMKNETGPGLLDRLEILYGRWMDPCVEDVMWCVVHHANNPGSDRRWFDFTEQRKAYRTTYGYPPQRPTRAWYDAD